MRKSKTNSVHYITHFFIKDCTLVLSPNDVKKSYFLNEPNRALNYHSALDTALLMINWYRRIKLNDTFYLMYTWIVVQGARNKSWKHEHNHILFNEQTFDLFIRKSKRVMKRDIKATFIL